MQLRTMKRARDIREQLVGLMERVEISMETCGDEDVPIRKALTAGYFYNAAQLSKPTEAQYKTVKQRHSVFIHPGSGAPPSAYALPALQSVRSGPAVSERCLSRVLIFLVLCWAMLGLPVGWRDVQMLIVAWIDSMRNLRGLDDVVSAETLALWMCRALSVASCHVHPPLLCCLLGVWPPPCDQPRLHEPP